MRAAQLFLIAVFVTQPLLAQESKTQWVSVPKQRAGSPTEFRRTFSVPAPVTSATLRCVGESAHVNVFFADEKIVSMDAYDPIAQVDMTDRLRTGEVEILVQCVPVKGPSAFFLLLEFTTNDGKQFSVRSDASWLRSSTDAVQCTGVVDRRLLVPLKRQIGIRATDNYAQWKQARDTEASTDPASFQTTPGFEIQLLRSAKKNEGSWVSMVFDSAGRVLIAKEERGILRVSLSNDGDWVEKVETIEDTLLECRGLAFIGDTLFANANNSKALYRLEPNGSDGFKKPKPIYKSSGGVGHGRNDLAVGPDGMLYSIHGDSVDLPDKCVDYTSPFRKARRGTKTSEGHLLRIDPDDGSVQVLAAGLRNPFGIDFNEQGDIFTYDADAEYDMGAPWYRPTRVSHLVTGGDYGWRGVTKSWPPYYPDHPDNARPNLDIGRGSPTAVKFGAKSNFPGHFRDALYILDWSYGRIIAVNMVPRGASYLMTAETFLKGAPLNVTDLDFGPDGAMYFVTGGRKTQSSLYRVRYTGGRSKSLDAPSLQSKQRLEFAEKSRQQRLKLEAALVEPLNDKTIDVAAKALRSADPWIRYAARNLLERLPQSDIANAVESLNGVTATLEGLIAVARANKVARPNAKKDASLIALEAYVLAQFSHQQKLQAIHTCNLGWSTGTTNDTLTSLWANSYPSESQAVNRALVELLANADNPVVVPKTTRLLHATNDQAQQMHYLYSLRNVTKGWTPSLRREYFRSLAMTKYYVGGEGMRTFLDRIKEEAIATIEHANIPDSEVEDLKAILDAADQAEELVATNNRTFVREWKVDQLATRVARKPDLERGASLFAEATCVRCHRFGSRGTWVGPDLTSVSRRFGRRDLLQSILEPSAVIAEKYQSLKMITKDGKTYVGQVAIGGDFRSPGLKLSVDPNDSTKTVTISKAEIDTSQPSRVSWMPKGLLDTFTREEIDDLLGYLSSDPTSRRNNAAK